MTAINYVRNLAGGGVGAARFGQALPPTGTAAWPSGPSGALHTGGLSLVRHLGARPGPATRGRRGQATPRALAVAPKGLPERKIAPA